MSGVCKASLDFQLNNMSSGEKGILVTPSASVLSACSDDI